MTVPRLPAVMVLVLVAVVATSILVDWLTAAPSTQTTADWETDWAVQREFGINIDAQGFRFPPRSPLFPIRGMCPKILFIS